MTSPADFSQRFDSIDIDPMSAPSPAAIERALEIAAPPSDAPGFTLVDDAGGRFVVDPEFGFVSLASDDVLARERGREYGVTLRVVEKSGASYQLELKLRITGRVPQMVGAEDFGFAAPAAAAEPAPVVVAEVVPPPAPWTSFAAALAQPGKAPLVQARGAFIAATLPATDAAEAALALTEPAPEAYGASASWSL